MTIVSLYIDELFHIMIGFLPLYCIARILWVQGSGSNRSRLVREIVMAVFVLFMIGLLTLTFREGQDVMKSTTFARAWERLRRGDGVNLKPFYTIKRFLKVSSPYLIRVNIIGNIVMFMPWGLGLPLLWKKFQSVWKVTIMSLALPLCIEFTQLFVGRTVDVDDIILNFIGGVLGGLIYLVLSLLFSKVDELAE